MKLIDASIIVYALGEEHSYRKSCVRVMADAYSGAVEATVDTELLQEILHIYRRRGRLDFGLAAFDRLTGGFPHPLPVLGSTMLLAREVLGRHPRLQARDAVHAAVVQEHGMEGIISTDRGFDMIQGLRRFDPLELGKSW